jgi:hypothetical protein
VETERGDPGGTQLQARRCGEVVRQPAVVPTGSESATVKRPSRQAAA